ncbi:MAG: hypothetical protein ABI647_09030 [Gemmatimonadota bacterium]
MHDRLNDEQFDKLMSESVERYRVPPEPDLDRLWPAIEAAALSSRPRARPWLAYAAVLLAGIGLGYGGSRLAPVSQTGGTVTAALPRADGSIHQVGTGGTPFVGIANDYLAKTTALLVAVASDLPSGQVAPSTVTQARHLLSTTRLLLDAGVGDTRLRELLEDLELVLAQVVRFPDAHQTPEAALLGQTIAQRDILPRLTFWLADAGGTP